MKKQPFIVVVDNDPEDCAFIRHSFMQVSQHCNIRFLESGFELLDLLTLSDPEDYPALIVLDYNMPELNGRETVAQIKENPFVSHIPVLIYSTSVTAEMKKELAAFKVLNCMEKSTSEAKLVEQARYFLELVETGN